MLSASAQTVVFKGIVLDEIDKEPVKRVQVKLRSSSEKLAITDEDGEFQFEFTYKGEDYLEFEHIGFLDKSLIINKRRMRKAVKDTVYFNVVLEVKTLGPLSIKDPSIPDTIYGSEQHSISDYEFYENGYVMLAYDQRLRKGSKVMLVDKKQKILSEYEIPKRAKELYKDFAGEIYVMCEEGMYAVKIFGNKLRLEEIDEDHFYKYTMPIIDTMNAKVYYTNYNPDYPAFEYYVYNPLDSTHKQLAQVEDKLIMDLYMAEYKYVDGAEKVWAMRKEKETGIDKEIWIGLKYFTNNIYYKALYAPMFVVGGELVVFDHYSDYIKIYDEEDELIDSTQIYYHHLKGRQSWEKQVLKDQTGDQVYTVLSSGGYQILAEINLETGELGNAHKLYHKYTENIQVRNGSIYYIYRPFESAQKKFIYKEKIQGDT